MTGVRASNPAFDRFQDSLVLQVWAGDALSVARVDKVSLAGNEEALLERAAVRLGYDAATRQRHSVEALENLRDWSARGITP